MGELGVVRLGDAQGALNSGVSMSLPRSLLALAALLALASAGCATTPLVEPAPAVVPQDKELKPSVELPEGFMVAQVLTVVGSDEGAAVILADESETRLLPIFIGPGEALSIQLRLDRRRYVRPLTHDLLDVLVKELGGEVLKIHIDGLKNGIFVGTVFVWDGARLFEVDARPSDALALAVGNKVPIFLSTSVMQRAGIDRSELPDLPMQPDGPDGVFDQGETLSKEKETL